MLFFGRRCSTPLILPDMAILLFVFEFILVFFLFSAVMFAIGRFINAVLYCIVLY